MNAISRFWKKNTAKAALDEGEIIPPSASHRRDVALAAATLGLMPAAAMIFSREASARQYGSGPGPIPMPQGINGRNYIGTPINGVCVTDAVFPNGTVGGATANLTVAYRLNGTIWARVQ